MSFLIPLPWLLLLIGCGLVLVWIDMAERKEMANRPESKNYD